MKKMLCLMAVVLILSTVVQVASARENSPPGSEIVKMAVPVVHQVAIVPVMQGIGIDAPHDLNGALIVTRDYGTISTAMDVAFVPLLQRAGSPAESKCAQILKRSVMPIQRE